MWRVQLGRLGKVRVHLRPKQGCLRMHFSTLGVHTVGIGGIGRLPWKPVKPIASTGSMERAMGIETTSEGWETCAPNSVQSETKKLPKLTALSTLTSEAN
jgi:hypothetical protein